MVTDSQAGAANSEAEAEVVAEKIETVAVEGKEVDYTTEIHDAAELAKSTEPAKMAATPNDPPLMEAAPKLDLHEMLAGTLEAAELLKREGVELPVEAKEIEEILRRAIAAEEYVERVEAAMNRLSPQLGQEGYEAYRLAAGGVSLATGQKLPDWHGLSEDIRSAWTYAAGWVCALTVHRTAKKSLNDYARESHTANKKWWQDVHTGEPIQRNKGELLMLMVSEISEAMEGCRKSLPDDKLPHRSMEEVELADCLIRIFDYAGGFGLDLEGAYREKMAFNAMRSDHTHEARRAAGGKKF